MNTINTTTKHQFLMIRICLYLLPLSDKIFQSILSRYNDNEEERSTPWKIVILPTSRVLFYFPRSTKERTGAFSSENESVKCGETVCCVWSLGQNEVDRNQAEKWGGKLEFNLMLAHIFIATLKDSRHLSCTIPNNVSREGRHGTFTRPS